MLNGKWSFGIYFQNSYRAPKFLLKQYKLYDQFFPYATIKNCIVKGNEKNERKIAILKITIDKSQSISVI